MQEESFATWGIIEVMGRQRWCGYITTIKIAGGEFLRVDVPGFPAIDGPDFETWRRRHEQPAFSKIIGHSSVYSITPTSEEVARRAAENDRSRPLQDVDLVAPLTQLALPAPAGDDDSGEDFDDGYNDIPI